MTKLKSVIAVFALAILTTTVFANSISEAAQQQIRKQIAQHLQNIDLTRYNVNEASIQLTFMVNSQNEIVVLSTNNERFDGLLKAKLNYLKLNLDEKSVNQIFSVPITLKS